MDQVFSTLDNAVEKQRQVAIETLKRTLITLSHYINNSLTAILGRAEMCVGQESFEKYDKLISECRSQTERILTVLKALDRIVKDMDMRTTHYPGIQKAMFDIEKEVRGMPGDT